MCVCERERLVCTCIQHVQHAVYTYILVSLSHTHTLKTEQLILHTHTHTHIRKTSTFSKSNTKHYLVVPEKLEAEPVEEDGDDKDDESRGYQKQVPCC